MKLATLNNGSRDGQLVVVSTDMTRCAPVDHIAQTMQDALDNWSAVESDLLAAAAKIQTQGGDSFDPSTVMAPLPRAHLWADGSAYVNHVALVRQARGAEVPESFWTDPLMYIGASDAILGPCEDIPAGSTDWGIDMEAEVAVITDDVPMGVSAEDARRHIKLIMILNDVSFRALIPGELAKGFGFCQSKGPTAFSPVAITPDELGNHWNGGTISLPLLVDYNDAPFGKARVDVDMTFDFGQLVAHAAKTRKLGAGAIIGSGTISNRDPDGSPGKPVPEGGNGYSCIAEIRMIETIRDGKPATPFMSFGDRVRIEMKDESGATIFGAIDQRVIRQ